MSGSDWHVTSYRMRAFARPFENSASYRDAQAYVGASIPEKCQYRLEDMLYLHVFDRCFD
jgi:hypothetical protein